MIATDRGMVIPARLRLVEDSKKMPGEPTRKWYEPVIEFVETTFADLAISGPSPVRQIAAPAIPALPAIAPPASSDFRAVPHGVETGPSVEQPTIIEHSPALPATVTPSAVAGTCGWRLAKPGGEIIPCTFDAMHPDRHSWDGEALSGGGKVLRPE
jgi:hypothetical protein